VLLVPLPPYVVLIGVVQSHENTGWDEQRADHNRGDARSSARVIVVHGQVMIRDENAAAYDRRGSADGSEDRADHSQRPEQVRLLRRNVGLVIHDGGLETVEARGLRG